MNRTKELREKRATALNAAAALLELAKTEGRALTNDEDVKYSTLYDEAESWRKTEENEERQAKATIAIDRNREQENKRTGGATDKQLQATIQWCRFGFDGVDEELREHLVPANQDAPDFRANRPERRGAQSSVTGNLGGYTVPEGFMDRVIEAKKFFGGIMEAGPELVNTTSGNNLPWPTSNDTGNKGVILPENSPESSLAIPFDVFTLGAFKYSSRIVLIPIELLQDSGVDIEGLVVRKLAERLGRIQNEHFTTGTGNSQPQGVVVGSALGKGGASATAVAYTDLVDLKYSVNKAYRANAKWMMNDLTMAAIMKLEDMNGRPLILDQIRSLQVAEGEVLLGQPLIINDDMAPMGASAKSILYGDFSNYKVRRVRAMMLMRLVERYAELGQVGFLAFERCDGRLGDAGTNPIKYFQNHS